MASKKTKFKVTLMDKETKKPLFHWDVALGPKPKYMDEKAYRMHMSIRAMELEKEMIEGALEFKWEEKK